MICSTAGARFVLFLLAINRTECAGGVLSHTRHVGQSCRLRGIEFICRSVFQFNHLAFVIATLPTEQQRNKHTFESEHYQETQHRESKNLPYVETQLVHHTRHHRDGYQTEDK